MSQRTERVDELLREEIGALLAREVADPRIGFATITDVETSPDLRHAKVWVSIIGDRTDQVETLRALQAAMGFVKHELGRRLRIKRIPDLHVKLDDTAARGTRLLHLLDELSAGRDPDEIPPLPESLPRPVTGIRRDEGSGEDADTEAGTGPDGFGAAAGPVRPRSASRRRTGPGRQGSGGTRPGAGGGRPSGRRRPGKGSA